MRERGGKQTKRSTQGQKGIISKKKNILKKQKYTGSLPKPWIDQCEPWLTNAELSNPNISYSSQHWNEWPQEQWNNWPQEQWNDWPQEQWNDGLQEQWNYGPQEQWNQRVFQHSSEVSPEALNQVPPEYYFGPLQHTPQNELPPDIWDQPLHVPLIQESQHPLLPIPSRQSHNSNDCQASTFRKSNNSLRNPSPKSDYTEKRPFSTIPSRPSRSNDCQATDGSTRQKSNIISLRYPSPKSDYTEKRPLSTIPSHPSRSNDCQATDGSTRRKSNIISLRYPSPKSDYTEKRSLLPTPSHQSCNSDSHAPNGSTRRQSNISLRYPSPISAFSRKRPLLPAPGHQSSDSYDAMSDIRSLQDSSRRQRSSNYSFRSPLIDNDLQQTSQRQTCRRIEFNKDGGLQIRVGRADNGEEDIEYLYSVDTKKAMLVEFVDLTEDSQDSGGQTSYSLSNDSISKRLAEYCNATPSTINRKGASFIEGRNRQKPSCNKCYKSYENLYHNKCDLYHARCGHMFCMICLKRYKPLKCMSCGEAISCYSKVVM